MEHTMEPLVISASAFADFRRCRKKYELAYVRNLDVPSSDIAQKGTAIHELLAAVANSDREFIDEHMGDPMYAVVQEYIQHKGLPGETLLVETPIFTQVLDEEWLPVWNVGNEAATLPEGFGMKMPAVYIRTTYDRVYREGDWIVEKDYKSFDRAPTLYIDLDFQGRIYIATGMKHFQTDKIRFEYEYIRQEVGRELKGKGYVAWTPDERYLTIPLMLPGHEIKMLWSELQDTARDLIRCQLLEKRWYRTDLKTGPHSCGSCFHRQLCGAEVAHGYLDDDDVAMFSTPRDPADRMNAAGMLADPRVLYRAGSEPVGLTERKVAAVKHTYGLRGAAIVERAMLEGSTK